VLDAYHIQEEQVQAQEVLVELQQQLKADILAAAEQVVAMVGHMVVVVVLH
jgi:hypothetical protein